MAIQSIGWWVGIIFFSVNTWGIAVVGNLPSVSDENQMRVKRILRRLVGESFPVIQSKENLQLRLYELNDNRYYFESLIEPLRLLGKPRYKIGVNPIIFHKNISDRALKAILAHELVHTEQYIQRWLLQIAYEYIDKTRRRKMERGVDLQTIKLGFAMELIEYRHWQYALLSNKELRLKKLEYLTPAEIELANETLETQPIVFAQWLQSDAPLSLQEMKE